MHTVVIGAGVNGICTAYYLRLAGCDVTVLERHSGVAQESSFGCAGLVGPLNVFPWAAPGMPWRMFSSLWGKQNALKLHPTLQAQFWRWFKQMRIASTPQAFEQNLAQLHSLANYNLDCLKEIRQKHHLEYEQGQGVLHLIRTEREQKRYAPLLAWLTAQNLPHQVLDAQACRALEPSLAFDTVLLGGIWLPEDESGNCPLFAKQLRQICQDMGVQFKTQSAVQKIDANASGVVVHTPTEAIQAHRVVIAAGQESAALMQRLGVQLPLLPVTYYSATLNVKNELAAPRIGLIDDTHQLSISRLGNRLRITGLATIAGGRASVESAAGKKAIDNLVQACREWLPTAGDYSRASYWAGLRSLTPEGLPLVGASSVPNVYLNTGHSGTGWSFACGAAKLIADNITGAPAEIALDGLTMQRYPLRKAA